MIFNKVTEYLAKATCHYYHAKWQAAGGQASSYKAFSILLQHLFHTFDEMADVTVLLVLYFCIKCIVLLQYIGILRLFMHRSA